MSFEEQSMFLGELGSSGNIALACATAGVTRRDAFAQRDASPAFERAWRLRQADANDLAATRSLTLGRDLRVKL